MVCSEGMSDKERPDPVVDLKVTQQKNFARTVSHIRIPARVVTAPGIPTVYAVLGVLNLRVVTHAQEVDHLLVEEESRQRLPVVEVSVRRLERNAMVDGPIGAIRGVQMPKKGITVVPTKGRGGTLVLARVEGVGRQHVAVPPRQPSVVSIKRPGRLRAVTVP